MKKVLSLIQPTGDLHLGNYFGAIKNWVDIQDQYECYFGVADYHTLTMTFHPDKLRKNIWQMAFYLIAAGVKPENLFLQSLIPEHAELCWILNNFCSYGELTRMTQFKDKSDQTKENSKDAFISAGLMVYPVLQAADILIYHADYVPIGKDQEQHLELSRNIATRFNNSVGKEYFVHPEPLYTEFPKILSPANPEKKMSKSLGEKHYINLFGEAAAVAKQIRSAVTDSGEQVAGEMSPGVRNLFELLKACGRMDVYNHYMDLWKQGPIQYGPLKGEVAEAIAGLTGGFRQNLDEVMDQKDKYKEEIYASSERIRKVAQKTMKEVRSLTGFPKLAH